MALGRCLEALGRHGASGGRRRGGREPGVTLLADAPFLAPAPEAVMARAQGENFPVASRVLPRAARAHLLAIYGFARLVDELGDSVDGDRLAALDWLEGELDAAFAGQREPPAADPPEPTLRECASTREPFVRLIEANRLDQRQRPDTRPGRSCRAYCAALGRPGRRAGPGRPGAVQPRADRALRPDLHGAAADRALPGRRRGPPGRAASICRSRTWRGSAARSMSSQSSRRRARCGRSWPSRWPGPAGSSTRGRR